MSSGRLCFSRQHRLITKGDFNKVFKRSRRYSNRFWTVLSHRSDTGARRLGLAVAKKRAKRAVDRNRLKRIAREAFRLSGHKLDGCHLVVMNKDAAAAAGSRELRDSLDSLIDQIARQSGSDKTVHKATK